MSGSGRSMKTASTSNVQRMNNNKVEVRDHFRCQMTVISSRSVITYSNRMNAFKICVSTMSSLASSRLTRDSDQHTMSSHAGRQVSQNIALYWEGDHTSPRLRLGVGRSPLLVETSRRSGEPLRDGCRLRKLSIRRVGRSCLDRLM